MAKYNSILEIDKRSPKFQELKAAIKENCDKSMHIKYKVIYHHLKGAINVDIAIMFDLLTNLSIYQSFLPFLFCLMIIYIFCFIISYSST